MQKKKYYIEVQENYKANVQKILEKTYVFPFG
jgi:hypothetical protein